MPLAIGTAAPDFRLMSHKRDEISLEDLKGKQSMIVFMPFMVAKTGYCLRVLRDLRGGTFRHRRSAVAVPRSTAL